MIHLDLLRIFAIFFVIFNHTGEKGFFLFADRMQSPFYLPYMFASVFCKIAVPLFFMISGALLLGKEESFKQLFCKRIARIFVVLVIASIPYYIWLHRSHGLDISSFFGFIYQNSATSALWYLYSYIGLLLVLPFLRGMVRGMKQNEYLYLLIGHIVLVGIVPCVEYCLGKGSISLHESFSAIVFTTQNVFYALMGYFIECVLDKKYLAPKRLLLYSLLSVAAVLISCGMTHYMSQVTGVCNSAESQVFFNNFICVPAITVYAVAKYAGERICFKNSVRKFISALGGAVFGVYLIEKFLRALTSYTYSLLCPIFGSFIASLLWSLSALILGFVVILILKHTPVIKKLTNRLI